MMERRVSVSEGWLVSAVMWGTRKQHWRLQTRPLTKEDPSHPELHVSLSFVKKKRNERGKRCIEKLQEQEVGF